MHDLPHGWTEKCVEAAMARIIDYRGKTPPKTTSGIPLVTAKIIKGGRLLDVNEFIAEDYYDAWMRRGLPERGDVVITTEAPMGEVAQLPTHRVALAQRVILLRGLPDLLDNTYLKFLLQWRGVQNRLRARESGTTVTGIKQRELRKVLLPLPPLPEQRRIAAVLGALDDKIELNRKMNRTLEEMAQALFKSWFIDFDGHDDLVDSELGPIPRGWEVGTIDEHFDLTMGLSPPGTSYNEDGDGLPFFQGARDFGVRFPTRRVYTTDARRIANAQDTLISVRAPVGRANIAVERCCIGRGVAALRHNSGSRSYTFAVAKHLEHRFEVFNGEGTVFGSINKKDFLRLPLIVPPAVRIRDFDDVASPLDDRIRVNQEEMLTLAELRDTLLPKLISGELRVPEAEEMVDSTASPQGATP